MGRVVPDDMSVLARNDPKPIEGRILTHRVGEFSGLYMLSYMCLILQIFFSLNKNLYAIRNKSMKMKFGLIAQQIIVVQICLNFKWCQFAFI